MSFSPTQLIKALIPAAMRPAQVARRSLSDLAVREVVAGGPFAGMIYPAESVGSANWPKRLGVYENELVDTLTRFDAVPPPVVINVGAAEGYYALGCARRWPTTKIIAFEQDPAGRELLTRYAARNQVSERIDVRGLCTPAELSPLLRAWPRGLLLMDVEGAEDELLDGPVIDALRQYHVVVELHDLRRERLGERLRARFEGTHRIEQIETRPRRLSDFSYPANPLLRLYLFRQLRDFADELRGAPMRWFVMAPREASRP
ncbi:MAG TPA: hypothetical protein VGD88_05335 [Opitutaceae bacterium]